MKVLADLRARRVAEALLPLLEAPEPAVRRETARAIGRQRSRAALGALALAATDPDPDVRSQAIDAIVAIAEDAAR